MPKPAMSLSPRMLTEQIPRAPLPAAARISLTTTHPAQRVYIDDIRLEGDPIIAREEIWRPNALYVSVYNDTGQLARLFLLTGFKDHGLDQAGQFLRSSTQGWNYAAVSCDSALQRLQPLMDQVGPQFGAPPESASQRYPAFTMTVITPTLPSTSPDAAIAGEVIDIHRENLPAGGSGVHIVGKPVAPDTPLIYEGVRWIDIPRGFAPGERASAQRLIARLKQERILPDTLDAKDSFVVEVPVPQCAQDPANGAPRVQAARFWALLTPKSFSDAS